MLSCKEVALLVSESLDTKFSLRKRFAVRMHLLLCHACSQYQKQMLFLKKALRHYQKKTNEDNALTDESLSSVARERIKKMMEEDE